MGSVMQDLAHIHTRVVLAGTLTGVCKGVDEVKLLDFSVDHFPERPLCSGTDQTSHCDAVDTFFFPALVIK